VRIVEVPTSTLSADVRGRVDRAWAEKNPANLMFLHTATGESERHIPCSCWEFCYSIDGLRKIQPVDARILDLHKELLASEGQPETLPRS
jgi:hypothetical protein